MRHFFDPPKKTNVVLIDDDMIQRAERQIKSCEGCMPAQAQMPFDWWLDRITACDPSVTDYVLVLSRPV
jgi:hypothetical protein